MKIKHIIFDFDGTLADSGNHIYNTLIEYFTQYRTEFTDSARYYFSRSHWVPLIETLENIFKESDIDIQQEAQQIYHLLENKAKENALFPWVREMLSKLKKEWYKLYISTWNSNTFVESILWETQTLFEHIMGSSKIQKSEKHIDEFIAITDDHSFVQNAVFVWDGERDGFIAHQRQIEFIKIWKTWEYKHEIDWIQDFPKKLQELKS